MYAVDFPDRFRLSNGTLEELRQVIIHSSIFYLTDYKDTMTELTFYRTKEIDCLFNVTVTNFKPIKEILTEVLKDYEECLSKIIRAHKPLLNYHSSYSPRVFAYIVHKSSTEKMVRYKQAKEYLDKIPYLKVV